MVSTVAAFLSFFPYFVLLPLGTSEVQPWCYMVGALGFCLQIKQYSRGPALIGFAFLGLLYAIWFGLYLVAPYCSLFRFAESCLICSIPLPWFLYLARNPPSGDRFFLCAAWLWIGMSLVQYLAPSLLRITGLEYLFSIIIKRFSSAAISDVRGVVGFSPEPSYAAQTLVGLWGTYAYLLDRRLTRGMPLGVYNMPLFIGLLACVAVNKSISGLLFTAPLIAYVAIGLARYNVKTITGLLGILFAVLAGVYLSIDRIVSGFSDSRLAEFIEKLVQGDADGGPIRGILSLSASFGSHRTESVIVGYGSLVRSYGLGFGPGGWSNHFLEVFEWMGFDVTQVHYFMYFAFENIKPYSYLAFVACDLGLPGLIIVAWIVCSVTRGRVLWTRPLVIILLGLSVFMLAVNTVASLPTGWWLLLLVLYIYNDRVALKRVHRPRPLVVLERRPVS